MDQLAGTGVVAARTPSFALIGRQPLRPGVVLAAAVVMALVMGGVLYGLSRSGRVHLGMGGDAGRSASAGARGDGNDDDDPNQVDTIVLGDAADAPVPAKKGDHVSPVHATILIRLPRFGDQTGLIPDSPAGRLLFDWLAAFNQANRAALGGVLPHVDGAVVAAQMELREKTGGFALVSAKEVRPGVVVFRLRDQTLEGTEVLGTLQAKEYAIPAEIATFSLRSVPGAVGTAQ